MIHLILTLDYEIYGSGAGDVIRDIIEPTNRLFDICDKYGAKLTIMFEVAEYWAFKQAEQQGRLNLDYSPAGQMEKQVKEAVQRGHDVQLHLHPQWIGSELRDGLWHLNYALDSMADMPNALGDKEDIFSIIGALHRGKKTLEDMLKPIREDYECLVYRAGGFCIQPAGNIIKAMKEVGLTADTSIIKNSYEKKAYPPDFQSAEAKNGFWWTKVNDVTKHGEKHEGIIEFPIHSQMKPYIYNLKLSKLKATLRRYKREKKDPHNKIYSMPGSVPSKNTVFFKLFSMYPTKLDFCKLSSKDMYRMFVGEVNKRIQSDDDSVYSLVGIGHTKDFWNDRNFEKFIYKVSSNNEFKHVICFNTFQELLKQILYVN